MKPYSENERAHFVLGPATFLPTADAGRCAFLAIDLLCAPLPRAARGFLAGDCFAGAPALALGLGLGLGLGLASPNHDAAPRPTQARARTA